MRWLVSLMLLVGCSSGPGAPTGQRCLDDGDCATGSVCDLDAAVCREADCTDSTQCEMEHHCDQVSHTCEPGCAEDSDCVAGESCTTDGACKPYECRDTELDCAYGEMCTGGQCVQTNEPHCMSTETFSAEDDCFFSGGVNVCFGQFINGVCSGESYCWLECSTQTDCPRGLTCAAYFSNVPGQFCGGDCAFLEQNNF